MTLIKDIIFVFFISCLDTISSWSLNACFLQEALVVIISVVPWPGSDGNGAWAVVGCLFVSLT